MDEKQKKISELERMIQELRDRYEPEIVKLRAVAIAGPNRVLEAGYTADGRWVERIAPCRT